MTKYPAQNSGIDNSVYILGSPCAKMCCQACRCRVFWDAFKSLRDFTGDKSFGTAVWVPCSWAAILVSLSRALEFLFEAEKWPAKGLDLQ